MTRNSWIILCLAYIIGLLSTNLFAVSSSGLATRQLCIAIAFFSVLTLISAIALKKLRISSKVWLGAAIVAILAVFHFQLRIPQPGINNVVYEVSTVERELTSVAGKVITEPRLNASQKIKFQLKAQAVNNKQVSGKLYVSVPLLQGTRINLGEEIKLRGILYQPQAAVTSGGFDFKAYLARQGIFAGMQGLEVISDDDGEPTWGWWKLRRRIVRSHLKGLGSPVGQLVSSMVLGRKAVDLPVDIRDRFIEAGLAHVLAASGFHVSLLLGLILKLTGRLAAKPRLIIGVSTLTVYLGLTGLQASVLRACLMGCAVLIAMTLETKVKPLGSLLLVATIILLFNPLLISDLGFQLSFLATFGLIVTMPALQAKLDWLPPTIATLVAVPLAATVWVLPLLCYEFNIFATYSIIVNVFCTPLIMVISLGGMISAMIGLILPTAGSAIAWLLLYPTRLLITVINFITNLPGSSLAIGQISFGILLTVYGLLLLVWLNKQASKYWRTVLLFVLTLLIIPVGYRHFNLTQITVLPTQSEPVIVIQDKGKVILVNSGKSKTFQYTVLPFLNHQGINHLNYYVDLERKFLKSKQISDRLSIDNIIAQSEYISNEQNINQLIKTNTFKISFNPQLSVLKIDAETETWLILGKTKPNDLQIKQYIQRNNLTTKSITLVASSISSPWLQLNLKNIISFLPLTEVTRQNIQQPQFYNLKQNGAVTWNLQNKSNLTHQATSFDSIF